MLSNEEIQEKLSDGYILAKVIIEILGKPAEHVKQTLEKVIDVISKKEEFHLIGHETEDPIEKENMFSSFSEMDILFKDSSDLLGFCIDFGPSSVEVVKPTKIKLEAGKFGNIINDFLANVHRQGIAMKSLNVKNRILKKSNENLIKNLIIVILKFTKQDIDQLSKTTGIDEKQLKPFVDDLIASKAIEEIDGLYSTK